MLFYLFLQICYLIFWVTTIEWIWETLIGNDLFINSSIVNNKTIKIGSNNTEKYDFSK